MVHKIILALALCAADAFVPAGLAAPSSALSVATLDKAEAKTAAWPAKTAAWRAACDASGVVSYADFGIRVGAVEEAAPAPRVVVGATACAMHDPNEIRVHEISDGSPWLD